MDLASIYREIAKRVEKADFSALWKGFSPLKFAVYTDADCFFDGGYIPKTDAFCANTSIRYGGESIAIWHIEEEPRDLDALAASIIHEMFHAFQTNSGEHRWANEIEALFRYEYAAENLSGKLAEARCICEALESGSRGACQELLRLRKARAERYPYEYDYEARVEQVEGSAEFVEIRALSQLSPEKGEAAWRKVLDQIADPANYFPIRPICYKVGAAVLACMEGADFTGFSDRPFACAMLDGVTAGGESAPELPEAAAFIGRYRAQTRRIIRAGLEKGGCILRGEDPLLDLNIWDARREGQYLTSSCFLEYQDGAESRVLHGDFVLEVDEGNNILAVWRQ